MGMNLRIAKYAQVLSTDYKWQGQDFEVSDIKDVSLRSSAWTVQRLVNMNRECWDEKVILEG